MWCNIQQFKQHEFELFSTPCRYVPQLFFYTISKTSSKISCFFINSYRKLKLKTSIAYIFNRDDDCRSRFYNSLFFSFFLLPTFQKIFQNLFNFPLPTFQNQFNICTATDGNSIICFLTGTYALFLLLAFIEKCFKIKINIQK